MTPKNSFISQVARRFAAVMAECDYAQRQVAAPSLAPDGKSGDTHAPGTYRDFLRRTSGPLLREPSAAERMTGARVA